MSRAQLEREAAEQIAARIAEGRPPPSSWTPRVFPKVKPRAAGVSWYVSPADGPADPGTAGDHDVVEAPRGDDRLVSRRSVLEAHPFAIRVFRPAMTAEVAAGGRQRQP
jgi:hypothetical protein